MVRALKDTRTKVQPDQLVAELLARGDMNDETVVDLNRMLESWRAGALDAEDEAYLRALHARVMNLTVEPEEIVAPALARVDGLSIEEWRERALKAEAELAALQDASRTG
jgi:hypothetical protein